ncbi:MAG: hypothetical protein AAFZ17_17285 [Cyanobacteria bacterium J06650_10]
MTLNTSEKATQHSPDADNEFYVRAIAAWLLLLIPGFLVALMFGYWLHYLVIAPIVISPLTIWTYDLFQFFKETGNRSIKLTLLALMGFCLVLLLGAVVSHVYVEPSPAFTTSPGDEALIVVAQSTDEKNVETQQLQPKAALAQAKKLGTEASQMVQAPPYPLPIWESAQQRWAQAIQHLESISPDSEIYEEAKVKLASYRANQSAILQRIEVEKRSADNYEMGGSLIDEVVVLIQPITYPTKKDRISLKQISIKLEMAIQAFRAIPTGTMTSELAQERAATHSRNYQDLQSVLELLESCESTITFDCSVDEYMWLTLLSDFEKR